MKGCHIDHSMSTLARPLALQTPEPGWFSGCNCLFDSNHVCCFHRGISWASRAFRVRVSAIAAWGKEGVFSPSGAHRTSRCFVDSNQCEKELQWSLMIVFHGNELQWLLPVWRYLLSATVFDLGLDWSGLDSILIGVSTVLCSNKIPQSDPGT